MIQVFCAFSGLINCLACLSLAIFLYFKNRQGKINKYFALWSLSVAVWSLGYFMWLFTIPYQPALFWARFLMTGAIVIPTTYLHFALVYLKEDEKYRIPIIFGYLFSGVYLILDFTHLFIAKLEPRYWFRWWPVPGPLYHPYQVYFILVVICAHILLFRRAFSEGEEVVRKQFKIVALGTLVAYAGGSTNFFLWYNIPVPPVFNFLVTGYVAFIAYAIVHYGLWDLQFINVLLAKTGIFILVYAVVLGCPIAMVMWGKPWLIEQYGKMWWVLPVTAYTILTTAGPFLYMLLQRKAEDQLLREQRHYQQTLLQASRGMTLIKNLDHLLNLIIHMLTKTVRITHASIFLYNKDSHVYECRVARAGDSGQKELFFQENASLVTYLSQTRNPLVTEEIRFKTLPDNSPSISQIQQDLSCLHAAVIIPTFIRDHLTGFLVLGEKKSGHIYTQDDLNTLFVLANQAALAIENCAFLKQAEQSQLELFQASKMATIGTLSSGISHEVQNPLAIIRSGIEMLSFNRKKGVYDGLTKEGYQSAVDEVLERILAASERAHIIIKRLGSFAKKQTEIDAEPISFEPAIETAIELVPKSHLEERIRLVRNYAPGLPPAMANEGVMEDVFVNLIVNACHAIKGEGEIRVGTTFMNGEVQAFIQDTGCGIPPENLERIFDPFFTTKDNTRNPDPKVIRGTGLGLFIVREMIQRLGGRITVESQVGKGTTFRIFFPPAPPGETKNA